MHHPSDIFLTFPCSSLIQSVMKSCTFKLCNTLSLGHLLPFIFPFPLPCCTASTLHPFCLISPPLLCSTFWGWKELSGALPQVMKTSMASHCLTDKQHISSRDCRAATNSSQLSFLKQMLLIPHPYPFSLSWKSPTDLVERASAHTGGFLPQAPTPLCPRAFCGSKSGLILPDRIEGQIRFGGQIL